MFSRQQIWIYACTCDRCGKEWTSTTPEPPRMCVKCKSVRWNDSQRLTEASKGILSTFDKTLPIPERIADEHPSAQLIRLQGTKEVVSREEYERRNKGLTAQPTGLDAVLHDDKHIEQIEDRAIDTSAEYDPA